MPLIPVQECRQFAQIRDTFLAQHGKLKSSNEFSKSHSASTVPEYQQLAACKNTQLWQNTTLPFFLLHFSSVAFFFKANFFPTYAAVQSVTDPKKQTSSKGFLGRNQHHNFFRVCFVGLVYPHLKLTAKPPETRPKLPQRKGESLPVPSWLLGAFTRCQFQGRVSKVFGGKNMLKLLVVQNPGIITSDGAKKTL